MALVHGVKPTATGMRSVAASAHMLNAHRTIPIFRPTTACMRAASMAARLRASREASARHTEVHSAEGGAIVANVPQESTERRRRIRAAADSHHTETASIVARGHHTASVRGEASRPHLRIVNIRRMPSRDSRVVSRVSAAAAASSAEPLRRNLAASRIAEDLRSGAIVTMEVAARQPVTRAASIRPNVHTVPVTDRSAILSTPRRRCPTRCV